MRPALAPHSPASPASCSAGRRLELVEVALRAGARARAPARPARAGRPRAARARARLSAPPAHSARRTPPGTFSSRTSTRSPSRSYGPAVAYGPRNCWRARLLRGRASAAFAARAALGTCFSSSVPFEQIGQSAVKRLWRQKRSLTSPAQAKLVGQCAARSSPICTSGRSRGTTSCGCPTMRERLFEATADVDRLVILGDLAELREAPVGHSLETVYEFAEHLNTAFAGRQVVIAAGNHDHPLVAAWLESRRLRPKPLALPGRLVREGAAQRAARHDRAPAARLRGDARLPRPAPARRRLRDARPLPRPAHERADARDDRDLALRARSRGTTPTS